LIPKRLANSLLLAAGVASAAGAAAQTPRIFSVTVPMEIEYDSNPNMAIGSGPSTTWFRVRPSVTATQVQGNEEYSLEGALSAEKSSNSDIAKDRLDPRLRGVWKHADGINTSQVALLAERQALRALDIRDHVPVGVDGSRTLYAISGAWTRELSDRMSFTGDLRQDWERYSVNTTPDARHTTGSLRLTRLEDERRSWYGVLNAQLYRTNSRQDPVLGTVGGARSNVAGAVVGVNQLITEGLRVDANVGWMHFDQPTTDNDWQGALRAEYAGERWLASAEVARYAGVNASLGSLLVTEEVRLRARYAISPVMRVDFDFGHSNELAANSKRAIANLALVRQLSPAWELSVRASRRQQDVVGGTARSNLLALLLVYSAPDF
jgi:hypothetical protein